eukprot:scaffold150265_cov18-Prasinocladus_malaysianus.AAC.1
MDSRSRRFNHQKPIRKQARVVRISGTLSPADRVIVFGFIPPKSERGEGFAGSGGSDALLPLG